MDTITFTIGDTTIQLVAGDEGGEVLIWVGSIDHDADVVLSLRALQAALSTASMLGKS